METNEKKLKQMPVSEIRKKLMNYEIKRWQESRGKFVEFDIKTMNKYKGYYDEINKLSKKQVIDDDDEQDEGMGVDELEDPFISLGLAYSREEVNNLIKSVDEDDSGKIEFAEFLRIIHNKSKKKSKGNEKITNFFKNLANNKISEDNDLNYFEFSTIMRILRRKNLLKAFIGKKEEQEEGFKILKAYSNMIEDKKQG